MTPLVEASGAAVYHADWKKLLDVVPTCDALIVDAPYGQRTHAGHDAGAEDANRGIDYRRRVDRPRGGTGPRRAIRYSHWTPADVAAFVSAWSPRVNGWFVSITDHELARAWEEELQRAGRYVFAPLPYVAPGSRVRLAGDGPSNWTCWIVVARPRSREFATWGTLPGAYVLPPGEGGAMPVVGGKPRWLMEALVRDYSRPGGLCVDPCCGAGTTLAAAVRLGRRAVGGDVNPEHAELAARWVIDPGPTCPSQDQARQRVLYQDATFPQPPAQPAEEKATMIRLENAVEKECFPVMIHRDEAAKIVPALAPGWRFVEEVEIGTSPTLPSAPPEAKQEAPKPAKEPRVKERNTVAEEAVRARLSAGDGGPKSFGELAGPPLNDSLVRAAIESLRVVGEVKVTGQKRGTKYQLVAPTAQAAQAAS